jgi:hypothetical protein
MTNLIGIEDTKTRILNAQNSLIDLCSNYTKEHAPELAALFIQEKAVKLNVNIGAYKFTHGRWLDDEVIQRCINKIKRGY